MLTNRADASAPALFVFPMARFLYHSYLNTGRFESAYNAGRNSAVGDDTVNVFCVGYVRVTAFVELRRIEDQQEGDLQDHQAYLIEQCLLQIWCGHAIFYRERIYAQKQLVPVEVAQYRQRQRTHG